ncbi:MAG: GldG family protein [Verrucomicrobiota bacterium]
MSSRDDFRRTNRWRRLNILLQILFCLSLIAAVNHLGSTFFERRDLTEDRKFSLSPETEAYLVSVEAPVEIFVIVPDIDSDMTTRRVLRDLRKLLANMEFVAEREGNQNIRVEFIDVFRERNRAREVLGRHGITTMNSILVTSGTRMKQVSIDSLYTFEDGEMRAFRGETEFLSAILQVTQQNDQKVYFLSGQGELSLQSVDALNGLSKLYSFLQERGFTVETIELSNFARIPEDAGTVVIAAPATQFRERETSLLRDYLSNDNGSVLALFEPGGQTGLEELALEWGIRIDDRFVVDVGPDFQSATGDLIIREFSEHPVGNFIKNLGLTALFGLPRPILPDLENARNPDTIQLDTLLLTSPQSWAENELRPGSTISFDESEDLPGPVPIAVASQRSSETGFDFALSAVQGGKILVIGNADFITNSRLDAFGNRLLFLSALNWCMDVGNNINIAAKDVRGYMVILSQSDLRNLLIWLMIPASVLALIGILVALIRR